MELLYVGGSAVYGLQCGVSYSASDDGFDLVGSPIGARSAFFGSPILVSGSELVAM